MYISTLHSQPVHANLFAYLFIYLFVKFIYLFIYLSIYLFYCEAFTAVEIYPELHKASHSFPEEKSRTTNDKQPFGINGHKCDGFI